MTVTGLITGGSIPPITIATPTPVLNPTRVISAVLKSEAIDLPKSAVYVGVALAGLNTEAGVLALAQTFQLVGPGLVFSVDADVLEKTYYVVPQAFAVPRFFVGGFEGGFTRTVTGLTVSGVLMDIYESDQVNLGTMEVVVVGST